MRRILLLLCVATLSSAAHAKQPNILYLYVDDMGWGSIGPNGQAERRAAGLANVQTPNLDQLARQGLNFTRGYGCHVCSPARASQQTGFHQGHTFADRNDPDNAKKAMRREDITMGDALSAAGYATGYWGKWGFGGSKDASKPELVNLQTLPTSHGYQDVLAELHHVRAHTFFQPSLWRHATVSTMPGGLELVPNTLAAYRNGASYPELPALQNHPGYPRIAYCDDSYAFAGLSFVRRQATRFRETGQPFFGLLAFQVPHAPFDEITQLPDWDIAYRSDPKFASLEDQSRQWAAMVTRIDAHIGNILAALDDPNGDGDQGDSIAEDTLVVFQSDNGGPRGSCLRELNSNGGLRGTKGSIYEGGIRVPLILRWPSKINERSMLRAGSACEQVVDVTDLLPTFCDLAGAEIPLGVDGVSIAPRLLGETPQKQRAFIIHEANNQASIIRGNQKLIRGTRGKFELYDLLRDPAESNDLSDLQPKLVSELEELLLGERVTEKKGFSVTYHNWQGEDGDSTDNAEHWTAYRYANEGITYQLDDGGPNSAWVARMVNSGAVANRAIAKTDLQLLALEVRGQNSSGQLLSVEPDCELTVRNEIRIGAFGTIELNDARLSTLRWIEVFPRGVLSGRGEIVGGLHNGGTLLLSMEDKPFYLRGDYRQLSEGVLSVRGGRALSAIKVDGHANLDGRLDWSPARDGQAAPGTKVTVLTAARITGKFANENDSVITGKGQSWAIQYSPVSVSVIAQ